MYVIKVLKRRDAASVVVAVWLALSLNQILFTTYRFSNWITGLGDKNYSGYGGVGNGWRNEYLSPFVSFIVQIIALEILIRLFVWLHPMFVRKAK